MKIAIITDRYNPQINGVVTIVNNLEIEFKKMNIDYKIFSTYDCSFVNVPFYKQIQIAINPWVLKKEFKKYSPDVVIIMTESTLGQYFKKICLKNDIKFITFYNTNFHLYVHKILRNVILNLIKNFHKDSLEVYTVSNSSKIFLESLGIKNVSIFNVGVDRKIFKAAIVNKSTDRKYLMYVGRVSREKNIEDFLNLKLDYNHAKIIVGDGPLLEYFRKKYPDTMFTGEINHKNLAVFYNIADVLVFPSKTDTLGMVMIEAMACGTPIAAYDCDGPRDIVVNNVNGFMSDDLAFSIEKALLIDRKKCLEYSKKYTWGKSCKALIKDLHLM